MSHLETKKIESAIAVIGADATTCIINLPENEPNFKVENAGYDEDGFYLTSASGERYEIENCMSPEEYDLAVENGPFVIRSFKDGEIQSDEYEISILPRDNGLSFGA